MPIKRQHFIYHPDTNERLEIRAVGQLKPDQVLLGTGGDLTFGSSIYWEWADFLATIPGNERMLFRLRDQLKGDKVEKHGEDRRRETEEIRESNTERIGEDSEGNSLSRRLKAWLGIDAMDGSRRLS